MKAPFLENRVARRVAGRPGIAVKLAPEGEGVRVTVALDYLQKPTDLPRFTGVRFYTYYVPFGSNPTRVGWVVTDPKKQYAPPIETIILQNRQYAYTRVDVDRQENGAMTAERIEGSPQKVRLQGVYCYFGQLFVLNEVLGYNQPALLYPPA